MIVDFWWWFWVVYGIGCVIALVPSARFTQRELFDGDADTESLVMSVAMAFCVAPLWPLVVPGAWMYAVLRSDQREQEASR